MTYNVFSGTLNHTQSINQSQNQSSWPWKPRQVWAEPN